MEVTHSQNAVVDAWSTSDIVGFLHCTHRAPICTEYFFLGVKILIDT